MFSLFSTPTAECLLKMPNPVVTLRAIKNQSTGVDLSVSSIKENPGLISYVLEYSIIVVTNLQCFKLPQHKENDTVQFVVVKRYEDFEKFHQDLAAEFPRTMLPQMPKTFLTALFELNISEKHSAVEELIKFVAVTPIIATNHVTLEFLGVNPVTAGKYTANKLTTGSTGQSASSSSTQHTELFTETDNDDNLFDVASESVQSSVFKTGATFDLTNFPKKFGKQTRLFDEENLDGETIATDTEHLFLVPGAKVDKQLGIDSEDFSDLLRIDDGFEKLLQSVTTIVDPFKQHNRPTMTSSSSSNSNSTSTKKPMPMAKPKLPTETASPSGVSSKPALLPKPKVKPAVPLQAGAAEVDKRSSGTDDVSGAKLNIVDVMKYIEQNSRYDDCEPDLFS